MSTDVVRHRARSKSAGSAAKARREKIVLGVGILLLVGLLAFEGPRTLNKLRGSSPAPLPASPTKQEAKQAGGASRTVSLEKQLRQFTAKDPFASQLASGGSTATAMLPARAPSVRKSNFVAKDPFVPQMTATLTAPPTVVTAGGSKSSAAPAVTGVNVAVIVASVALTRGRKAADRAAAQARARGVPNVYVAFSSDYPTLRRGFYAIYSGPYPTLAEALKKLESIRGRGYVSAYTRRLAR